MHGFSSSPDGLVNCVDGSAGSLGKQYDVVVQQRQKTFSARILVDCSDDDIRDGTQDATREQRGNEFLD